MSGAGILPQSLLLVKIPQDALRGPSAVIDNTVPASIDIGGCAPEMADIFSPFPRLIVSPFTETEDNRPAGGIQGITHRRVGSPRVQSVRFAPVVL